MLDLELILEEPSYQQFCLQISPHYNCILRFVSETVLNLQGLMMFSGRGLE